MQTIKSKHTHIVLQMYLHEHVLREGEAEYTDPVK